MWLTSTYHHSGDPAGRLVDGGRKTETEKSVQSQVRVRCQGGQTGFKPRTEPPPQGPGGRCRGTYELCPSSSDA